jgi:hypothetical protein
LLLVVALRRQDVANDQLQRFKREWRPRVNKKYYGLRGEELTRGQFGLHVSFRLLLCQGFSPWQLGRTIQEDVLP